MKSISNADYRNVQQLLRNLAGRRADNLRDCNASRRAQRLLRKWERKDNAKGKK